MEEKLSSVFYIDGGSRPNGGYAGWGFHGYQFLHEASNKGFGVKDHFLTPTGYETKEFLKNGMNHITAWDFLDDLGRDPKVQNVKVINFIDGVGAIDYWTTNNVAELTGLLNCFNFLLNETNENVLLWLDSKYVIKGLLEWLPNWAKNNWKKSNDEEVANIELWKELYAKYQLVKEAIPNIKIEWIKGHSGHPGNDRADYNATKGIVAAIKNISLNEVKKSESTNYWTPKNDYYRLFAQKKWYFNTGSNQLPLSRNGSFVYHLGDHGKEDEYLGKKISDASFTVLFLKEAEPVLETVRQQQADINEPGTDTIVLSKLDTIFSSRNYKELLETEGKFLYRTTDKKDLYTVDGINITKELNPPRIAFNIISVMGVMEGLLEDFIKDGDSKDLAITDITNELYVEKTSGKKTEVKLSPSINSSTKAIKVKVNNPLNDTKVDLTLTIGLDIIKKNALSSLSKSKPKIYVITWKESSSAFRYGTVIKINGDYGIWACFYSNIHLL